MTNSLEELAAVHAAATKWLQRKVRQQAAALDALNRKVVSQRIVLRTLADLGRSLTAAEFQEAKAHVTNAPAERPPLKADGNGFDSRLGHG